ncbi:MAG TPA: hypothetical protein VFA33_11035 [Bryobacteraceae bacterium]|nr:hypothetical protein [Bryobacteraceae bacterium]
MEMGVGDLLALLAVPGGLLSLILFDKYSSLLRFLRGHPAFDIYTGSLPDKYFFIVFSMVITGAVTVLKWDQILPGPRDHANLAPLPLPARSIFLANLTAILLAASLFAVDVNAASAILFPFVVTAEMNSFGGFLHFVLAHALCVVLASAFTFFFCFAIMGWLMACLPDRLFRKVSLYVRILLMIGLLALLCTAFAVPRLVMRLPAAPDSLVRWVPAVWFVGLYQSLQGRGGAVLHSLGQLGLGATAAAFGSAMLCSALSYRRHFLRIPEVSDLPPGGRRLRLSWPAFLDRLFLPTPFQRACYHFTVRTLLRSETHCLLLGVFAGLGLVLASQQALSGDWLPVPLILAYLGICGLRFVFNVPVRLNANWIYQVVLDDSGLETAAVARKVMLSFLIPAVLLPTLLGMGWRPAAFVLAALLLLVEVLLFRFHKIPFTCTFPPFQNHVILLFFVFLFGFFLFTGLGAGIERWMLAEPRRFLALPAGMLIAWGILQQVRRDFPEVETRLIFQEGAAPAVQRLDL